MNISTKFNINEIVCHKFQSHILKSGHSSLCAYEILDINTNTCSAGTQIFYKCRPLYAYSEFKGQSENNEIKAIHPRHDSEFITFREDEIITALAEISNYLSKDVSF